MVTVRAAHSDQVASRLEGRQLDKAGCLLLEKPVLLKGEERPVVLEATTLPAWRQAKT